MAFSGGFLWLFRDVVEFCPPLQPMLWPTLVMLFAIVIPIVFAHLRARAWW